MHDRSNPIPRPSFENLFLEDPAGERFFAHWLGDSFPDVRRHFVSMGEAGAKATPLSARADANPPRLLTHDERGDRVNRLEFHPDYHALESLSYGGGIVSLKHDSKFLSRQRAVRHLVGFGTGYYFAQSELGLYCPICMTDGVARVLEQHAKGNPHARIMEETLSRLTTSDVSRLWQGAMFLTERQGGSDVGANAVVAYQEQSRWFLNGDKWFCSNVGADAILVLARMPGSPPGTRGLGLFLVLRQTPPRNQQAILIHRLKDKLGVRSMATGEVTLNGAEAYLVGGIGEGFHQMTEMLNLSRLYNSVASLAAMRRALLEALAYGSDRVAFGRPLWGLPLWRSTMADVQAEFWGAFVMVFETARALDRADNGDDEAKSLVRLLTPMVKLLAGKLAIQVVSECMEAIGGNGYIEESILPRLLRDAQVLPIWEGTSNILALDAMRANRKENAFKAFFARIQRSLDAAAKFQTLAEFSQQVTTRMELDANSLKHLATQSAENEQRGSREWVERAGRTFTLAMLLECATNPTLSEVCTASLRRLVARPFGSMSAMSLDAIALADTEAQLLSSGYTVRSSDSDD